MSLLVINNSATLLLYKPTSLVTVIRHLAVRYGQITCRHWGWNLEPFSWEHPSNKHYTTITCPPICVVPVGEVQGAVRVVHWGICGGRFTSPLMALSSSPAAWRRWFIAVTWQEQFNSETLELSPFLVFEPLSSYRATKGSVRLKNNPSKQSLQEKKWMCYMSDS